MLPDFGLRLMHEGYSGDLVIDFPGFKIYNISIVSLDSFTTMAEIPYKGVIHALSLDFGLEILISILARAEPHIREYVNDELARDPLSNRTIDLIAPIPAMLSAHLGSVQQNDREKYVPLIIDKVLSKESSDEPQSNTKI